MQRIVIDTNVLVSSLLGQSYPFLIIDSLFYDNKVEWCISPQIFQEYDIVLRRGKFSRYNGFTQKAEMLLAFVEKVSQKFTPVLTLKVISDISDNKFLELAVTCNAHFLITGNTNDFTISEYKHTKIVTPKEYWEGYHGNAGE